MRSAAVRVLAIFKKEQSNGANVKPQQRVRHQTDDWTGLTAQRLRDDSVWRITGSLAPTINALKRASVKGSCGLIP